MKTEIAHHIAHLLLENDCVIVPQLGGFVAHYVSSRYNEAEQLYMPPKREIAFNSQLKLNDGLLAQSYMAAYGMNFPEATKEIIHQVKQMNKQLQQEGVVDLPNIGELRFTMKQEYLFVPYTEVLTSPHLYGLSSFQLDTLKEIEEKRQLAALEAALTPLISPILTDASVEEEQTVVSKVGVSNEAEPIKSSSFKFGKLVKFVNTPMRIVTTAAAAILLFLVLSKPVGNTSTNGNNYAEIIPMNLFEQVIPQSQQLSSNDSVPSRKIKAAVVKINAPVVVHAHETATSAVVKTAAIPASRITPAKVAKQVPTATATTNRQSKPATVTKSDKSFYLIVASCLTQDDADREAVRIEKSLGEKLTCVNRNGKYRLAAGEYTNRTDATIALAQLRNTPNMESSWMLIVRN